MENVCRTCLRSSQQLYPLFEQNDLINKIETIASLKLINDENFPSTVCKECIQNINKLHNFRTVIINNDKDLKERIKTLKRISNNINELNKEELNDLIDEIVVPNIEVNVEANINGDINNTVEDSLKEALTLINQWHCKKCNETFNCRMKFNNHKKTHQSPGVCNICGVVVRADNLQKHLQTHSLTPVNCNVCGKQLKNAESLRYHTLRHKNIIFSCKFCNKKSKTKYEHYRHLQTHVNPESHKKICSICGKKVSNYKRHMYSHTGERPYICIYCQKGFSSSNALKTHTRQHTNEKPYICDICSMGFSQRVSLRNHIKSKHSTMKIPTSPVSS